MRRVVIVGATGSIGRQAAEVVQASDELEAVGLVAGRSWKELLALAETLGVERIALADPAAAALAAEHFRGRVHAGSEGAIELICDAGCDVVLNAAVGAAGLTATIAALGEGIDLALANKESLVVAGELVAALAEATGARIVPVDSEHSALFQLLRGEAPGTVERLVLTASGGPFRGRSQEEIAHATVEEALAHPTWRMGGKITVDSATLMNKGLEVIEAHHLFAIDYDRIEVLVHPQSIVHGLVELNDGALLAHLGLPDMRVPISYALHFPDRHDVAVPRLDLAAVGRLTFERPDTDTFPCLRLAREAGRAGGTAPCVLNAANEVAVAAFLDRRLPFGAIAAVVEGALERCEVRAVRHFDDVLAADSEARRVAEELVAGVRA